MQLKKIVYLTCTALMVDHTAEAFNSLTHEQITRSAFRHLETHAHFSPTTQLWFSNLGNNKTVMQELLIRTTIDADYQPDLWLDGWFHQPFIGGDNGKHLAIFTTMFHYMNVTRPGAFWDHDGYSYRFSRKKGNDSYLATPSAMVRGDLSPPLGGHHPHHHSHGLDLGIYRMGFKGSDHDWKKLFFNGCGKDAVFPPASVPAQMAFDALISSKRSSATYSESWTEVLKLITGLFIPSARLSRHFWRGHIEGLPEGFDLLGITLHMAQDLAMPHHTQGTADYCHPELEAFTDQLACNSKTPVSNRIYDTGQFGGHIFDCQHLYDPALVEQLRLEWEAFDLRKQIPVTERLRMLALISARWRWGKPKYTDYPIGTTLPNGREFSSMYCSDLLRNPMVQKQIRYQYNLAVAATLAFFELAAHEYEKAHPSNQKRLDDLKPFYFFP